LTIPVCIEVILLVELNVDRRRVVSAGNNVVETPSLLVMTASDDDPREGVAETDVLDSVVDGMRTDVTMVEEDVRVGGTAREEGLSDDETSVVNGRVWLVKVEDASTSVVAARVGGPFWFPEGPGGPFLFPPGSDGAFVFTASRSARAFGRDEEFIRLRSLDNYPNVIPLDLGWSLGWVNLPRKLQSADKQFVASCLAVNSRTDKLDLDGLKG
jgi:hypothetical protein